MDTLQQCSTTDGTTPKTKKYTRADLFKFAKLMNNSQSISKELDRFEHADWSHYNLDLVDVVDENEAKFNSIKSITSYGRKNSELDHEYSSLTDSRLNNEWRRSQPNAPMTRLSRMTSSPSIRTNNMKNQLNAHDDVPIHIKAKYAKMIESMSVNTGKQHHSTNNSIISNRFDLLNKDTSGSSWRNEKKTVERPTTLFGPLRRETASKKGDRRNSEEPMSLPYMSDYGARNLHSARVLPNTGARGLLDHNNPCPVQRLTSSVVPKKENQGHADEEDDFDITSLLNITVLSDIKIIRHDQHQHGSGNRPTLTKQYSTRGRNEDVGSRLPGIKPLLRARTSTDFTYQGRNLDSSEADQQHVNYSCFAKQCSKNGAESLNTYRWASISTHHQVNTFENREMAREKQQAINQSKENLMPVDKNVAHIIETFKAQVKARAEEKLIEPVATNPKASTASTCEGFQVQNAVKENTSTNVEKKNDDLYKRKEKKEVLPSFVAPSQDTAQVVDKLLKIGDNNQQSKLELELVAKKEQTNVTMPETTCNPVQQTVISDESATHNKPLQSKFVSHIPRLTRLLDLNKKPTIESSSETKAVSIPREKQQQLTIMSMSTSATALVAKATKVKPRFVSQYRRLRGKSLADEMEDMPK